MSQTSPIGGFYTSVPEGGAHDDDNVGELAQAVDAAIDAVGDALDTGNVGQAVALVDAADAVSDALLDALGVPDADEPEGD